MLRQPNNSMARLLHSYQKAGGGDSGCQLTFIHLKLATACRSYTTVTAEVSEPLRFNSERQCRMGLLAKQE